jgi:hypothetical protein
MRVKPVINAVVSRLSVFAEKVRPIAWVIIWIGAVGLAALIHLAFLVAWPDHFVHEDSSAYLDQAQSILTGHYVDDPVHRPYGVAFFLVLLSKVFSPSILVFATAQHAMSIVTAILIATMVRFSGAPRIFSLLAFLLAAVYARTVHYDNTIGAETLSVFLTTLAAFFASGIVFRKWPPFVSAIGIGLSLGAMMVCRSAGIAPAFIILLWLAIFVNAQLVRRLRIVALAGIVTAAAYFTPAAVNWIVGKRPAASENRAVMSFLVGYSADFNHGVHLERKALARAFVDEKRAADGPSGWADTDQYQWPLQAVARMRRPNESNADFEKVVRDIFFETLLTPSTLWRHITRHFAREMYFLLFDGSFVAIRVSHPQGYEFFVKREPFPIFNSPTGLKSRRLIYDNYSPPQALSWLLPSAAQLQSHLDALFSLGYAPRHDETPLCCGLKVSGEYDFSPGPIRWLSASTLILLTILLAGKFAGRSGWIAPLPRNIVAGGTLMILLGLINAAFHAFLIYGLHRYGYYAAPFLAGATGILGALLCDRLRLVTANSASRQAGHVSVIKQSRASIGAPSNTTMESEGIMAQEQRELSLSPLQTFFAKVAIVTGAFLIAAYFVASLAASFATSQMDKVASQIDRLGLKGGPAFWGSMETKLYALADAPDLPPEKKKKIIDAIHKLSVKYKPYVDAFVLEGEPAKPEPVQVRQ